MFCQTETVISFAISNAKAKNTKIMTSAMLEPKKLKSVVNVVSIYLFSLFIQFLSVIFAFFSTFFVENEFFMRNLLDFHARARIIRAYGTGTTNNTKS